MNRIYSTTFKTSTDIKFFHKCTYVCLSYVCFSSLWTKRNNYNIIQWVVLDQKEVDHFIFFYRSTFEERSASRKSTSIQTATERNIQQHHAQTPRRQNLLWLKKCHWILKKSSRLTAPDYPKVYHFVAKSFKIYCHPERRKTPVHETIKKKIKLKTKNHLPTHRRNSHTDLRI